MVNDTFRFEERTSSRRSIWDNLIGRKEESGIFTLSTTNWVVLEVPCDLLQKLNVQKLLYIQITAIISHHGLRHHSNVSFKKAGNQNPAIIMLRNLIITNEKLFRIFITVFLSLFHLNPFHSLEILKFWIDEKLVQRYFFLIILIF